jgi:hypothetical protein
MSESDRELLARAYHDYEAAVKAARKLWPNGHEATIREAVADFLVHVRELRRNGNGSTPPAAAAAEPKPAAPPSCPKCGKVTQPVARKSAKTPDFRCPDRECDTPVWLHGKRART